MYIIQIQINSLINLNISNSHTNPNSELKIIKVLHSQHFIYYTLRRQ